MDRRCNNSDKTRFSAGICAESRCHSPCCMAMQSGEIYQVQNARYPEGFTVCFTRHAPYSRRTCPARCR
ncbi:hypothetical protein A7A07_23150 [Salmonella enterica subsp. enterica serovar Muenchen]|nr:hypothetical protein [Salmonella enterica subsp. enterica serovar Muenchen]